MSDHFKGHDSLADMISTHIGVWRRLIEEARDASAEFEHNEHGSLPGSDRSYYEHELRALAEIEIACENELESTSGLRP